MPRKNQGTTVHISDETAKLLLALKQHPRETYDDVIRRNAEHMRDVHDSGGE